MARFNDPKTDLVLLALKAIATKGGDRGPLFDQGVLALIGQIERNGHFTRGGIGGLITLMHMPEQTKSRLLTDEEFAEGQRFLAQHGWVLDQAIKYADGVLFAEAVLPYYGRDRAQ
jgi:hypothetical protein